MAESESLTTDQRRGLDIERVWLAWDLVGRTRIVFNSRPPEYPDAIEYMRVMSRDEVEKLVLSEGGVDTQQLINSLFRTVAGQRREIARLHETVALRDRENGALAEGYLSKMGIKPEDLR